MGWCCIPVFGAIDIVFDYSLDTATGNFFDPGTSGGQAARARLEDAAGFYESRFLDELGAIEPGPSGFGFDNTWEGIILHPGTGAVQNFNDVTIPAGRITVWVGAFDLPGSLLGHGGPGGFNASGSEVFLDSLGRGQANTRSPNATDVAPWGGSIAFDADRNWHFGATRSGLSGKVDFLSTTIHELGHVLGFGATDSFDDQINMSSGTFSGSASTAVNGGINPGLFPDDESHWSMGTQSDGAEAMMNPVNTIGLRVLPTSLDYAAFDDIGWELSELPSSAIWVGGDPGIPFNWVTGRNWEQHFIARSTDVALFSDVAASYEVSLDGDWNVGSITFSGQSNYTISTGANTLVLETGDVTLSADAATHTIDGVIALNASGDFDVGAEGTLVIDGSIVGNWPITKTSSGTLQLNAANSYSGDTVVMGGEVLVANGSGSATGSGSVTVKSGAVLAGDGTVGGSVMIDDGGLLSPGFSRGVLLINDDLVLSGTAAVNVELQAPSSVTLTPVGGVDFDQLVVGGHASLGGSLHLALVDGYLPDEGDEFPVLVAGSRSGEFDGISDVSMPGSTALVPLYDYDGIVGLTLKVAHLGDANFDSVVDVMDLGILGANFNLPGREWTDGDFNGDGITDVGDLGVLGANWTAAESLVKAPAWRSLGLGHAVPEPATMIVCGVGFSLFSMRRRSL
tara:strand:+ start:1292 stop:3337 length:2046 start_codon:yes stop_codon:yes gene_type:complete